MYKLDICLTTSSSSLSSTTKVFPTRPFRTRFPTINLTQNFLPIPKNKRSRVGFVFDSLLGFMQTFRPPVCLSRPTGTVSLP